MDSRHILSLRASLDPAVLLSRSAGYALVFFTLAVLFIPGITGAATAPRWAFAAIMLPLITPMRETEFTSAHACGLLFIWYAAISVNWSHHYDGLDALIKLIVIAEAFVLGTKLDDLRPVIIGLGLGIAVNSLLMLLNVDLPHTEEISAGLFVNTNSLGEIAGLALVAAFVHRIWWLIPGILPAFVMAQCRGAFAAVGVALMVWLWGKSRWLVIAIVLVGAISLCVMPIDLRSMQQRFQIWGDIAPHLSLMGQGLGSTFSVYPLFASMDTLAMRPEHLHNDWLEYLFETGVLGFLSLCGCAAIIGRAVGVDRAILVALGTEALVGFPLHMAATAVMGGLVAGHAVRDRHSLRSDIAAWRISLRGRAQTE